MVLSFFNLENYRLIMKKAFCNFTTEGFYVKCGRLDLNQHSSRH